MVEQSFAESDFQFTDPVRFFKANDPYYFEVDNIPLKQIHENTLWLKDQVEKTKIEGTVTRSQFDELRPYVVGTDRRVRVRPGRYTARVNNAHGLTPAAILNKIVGQNLGGVDTYENFTAQAGGTQSNLDLEAFVDEFKSQVASTVLNMNGLMERAFTYPVQTEDAPSSFLDTQSPTSLITSKSSPFPLSLIHI